MDQAQAARTSFIELRHLVEAKNREIQERWELARWMCWHAMMLSPDIKPYNKKKTPHAFFPFPWEEPEKETTPEVCHISEETEAALNDIVKDYY